MSNETGHSRRTVLKSLGVAAGVGVAGSSGVIARTLTGDGVDRDTVPAEATNAFDEVPTATDWPQYQGNAAKTGVASSGPTSNASVAWRYDAGDDVEVGDPVVADDGVYFTVSPYDGYPRSDLVALTTDGDRRWERTWDDEKSYGYSTPAVHDGTVYTGLNEKFECRVGNHLLALDAETGEEEWRIDTGEHRLTAPTIADGILYCVSPPSMDDDGNLYAIEAETGKVLWQAWAGEAGSSSSLTPPVAVADGVVYLAADKLRALDAATGEVLWTADTDDVMASDNSPTVVDGTVYVGNTYDIRRTWVYAVDADDGSIEWTYVPKEDGREVHGEWTSATVAGGYVVLGYVPTESGRLPGYHALDPEDGSLEWYTEWDDTIVSPAAAGDGRCYVGDAALNAENGSVAWDLGGDDSERQSSPAVVDGAVYVGGDDLTAITGDVEDAQGDQDGDADVDN